LFTALGLDYVAYAPLLQRISDPVHITVGQRKSAYIYRVAGAERRINELTRLIVFRNFLAPVPRSFEV
jgi:hypothetical protein